jgi:hypothetical protein
LYTSDGCVFQCKFCAASKGRKERFRESTALKQDAEILARLTRKYAGAKPSYEIYLSTLDGFQNPKEMERTLQILSESFKNEGVTPKFRCLATSKFVYRAMQADMNLLERWRDYGLVCVGLGVDGSETAWQRQNKLHNDQSEINACFEQLLAASIQPEALMVMGLPSDSIGDLLASARFCQHYASQGITVRPYLGKATVPGSDQWNKDPKGIVKMLLDHPELFVELDYSCLGSMVSHPSRGQRLMANLTYAVTCAILKLRRTGCPTTPLFPTSSVPRLLRVLGRFWNNFVPGDR